MTDHRFRRSAVATGVLLALAGAAASAQDSTHLGEIIVTAQKRAESLQDVPLAISAVAGAKIAEAGIMKIEDLKNYVPTLFMTETAIGNNISIRGIFSGVNPGFEQSVGTYVDGVYRGRPQQTRAPFLDLERVEVLRGPQSILFGKNSVGGALNITTARPTEEFEAMVSALYEPEYDEQEFTASVSGPFGDRLRGRLAARYREVEGHLQNPTLGTDDPSREETTARAWLEWDVSDSVTVSLKAEMGEFDVTGRQIEIAQELPAVAGPFAGATYSQILAALGQHPSVLNNTADFIRSSNGDFSNNDTEEFVLQVDWQLGENTLTLVTARSSYEFEELCDCDFTGGNVFLVAMAEDFDQTSQEIRLTSPTGGKLEYILGAYYETSDLTFGDTILVPGNSVLVPLLNANPAFNGTPLQGIAGTVIANTGTPREFDQDAKSYSAFAQFSWNMSDEFRSTLGMRYTKEEKDATRSLKITDINGNDLPLAQLGAAAAVYRGVFNVRQHDDDVVPPSIPVNLGFSPTERGSRDEDQFLPSLTFEWSPDDSTMMYLGWSKGAKSGGFDARSNNPVTPPTPICTAPNTPPGCTPASGIGTFEFDNERATNLELGAKLRIGGSFEMNAALYMTDFEDLQVSTFDGVLGFNVRNAGEAEIKGLELDMRWQATDHLAFSSSLAYTDFEFLDYIGQCAFGQPSDAGDGLNCNYRGKTNEFVAPWVITLGSQYRRPIGSNLVLHLGADVYYSDQYFVAPTLDARQMQESYYKVNGRVGVGSQSGSWDVSLIGKNIFDEQILPYGNDTPLAGRTFGAFSAWRFVEPGRSVAIQGTVRF
ncbi:MAG TPA: TonB-dependent receptor [Steroidobacteraceae bacterium]|nr:TonB-dependent receptor [Steroidobacteraceae bacterium]